MGELSSTHIEPMYDDVQLDMFREQGIRELIKSLYDYLNQLFEKIAGLRSEVNSLHRQLSLKIHFSPVAGSLLRSRRAGHRA